MKNRCISKPLFVCLAIAALLLLAAVAANAAPAPNIPLEYTQPDGSTFIATLRGDEFFSYLETDDGSVLLLDENGYWCHAKADYFVGPMPPGVSSLAPELRATAVQYGSARRPTGAMTLEQAKQASNAATQAGNAQRMEMQAATSISPLGDQSLLVILIDFNDVSIQYESQWANRVFGTTGKTVKTYYNEATGGKINFVPAKETQGIANDGVVRVKLNKNHPNTALPSDYPEVFAEASRYVDFASYKVASDHNFGSDLHIMLVYAGYGLGGTLIPNVSAHYKLNSNVMVMGEKLWADDMATIGTFIHELGHSLGLPDLYISEWNDDNEPTLGVYSSMANNWGALPGEQLGTTPALLDAYCLELLGVVSPQVMNHGTNANATVYSWSTGSKNALRVASGVPNEYFLIECRNKEGFDLALPGDRGGVAVYRVNTKYKWGNSLEVTYAVIMLQLQESSNDNYLFYSTRPSGRTYFNTQTTPSNKLGNGGGYSWFRFDCLSDSEPTMNVRIQPDKPSGVYATSYNANGGSGGPTVQYKRHGENLILNNAQSVYSIDFNYSIPTRNGYTFFGWSTSSTATTAQYQPGGSFALNADTTLYAVWRQTFAVTVNNGTGGGSFAQGTTVTITANAAPSGQRFKQWNVSPTVSFTDGTTAASATAKFTMPAQAVTATAVYEDIPPATYPVTVNNGTGGGNFAQGVIVTITANTAPIGHRFKQWDVNPAVIFVDDTNVNNAIAKFTMPAQAVTATAIYELIPSTTYLVTVNSGSGGGSFPQGAAVTITANAAPSGQRFKQWNVSPSVNFTDGTTANSATATFSMPAQTVTATAVYEDIPPNSYLLTVNGGSGSGYYTTGTAVTITANTAPTGKIFDRWTSTAGTIANPASANTTFTMPVGAATVTANYKDAPRTILSTKYQATFVNWILFFFAFGWVWMWI